tara:strand:- start:434 stop:1207 length:774 start_codon:yes stop_codon:yes gene_type:complete
MKLTLESAVDFAKANSMSMKHHFDSDHEEFDLNPIITMYSKEVEHPLFQVILPNDAMNEENKRIAYMMATSVAGFIDADYITMVNDVFVAKHEKGDKTQDEILEDENYVSPSQDPNSTEALLILGMSKDRGMVVTQEYGRDDIGKMYYKDSFTDDFKYESVKDKELDRSWMTRIGAMALTNTGMKELEIEDDTNTKLALLYQAMHSMDDLDFHIAYTNLFADYMYDKFYSDDLDDEAKSLLRNFQSPDGFMGEDESE